MRRFFLPVALLALTGTLVAQTPQWPISQNHFKSSIFADSLTVLDADTTLAKGVRFEFENGVTISADEAIMRRGDYNVKLSGNVQMKVK